MILIKGGAYIPFVLKSNARKGEARQFSKDPVVLSSFWIDRDLITNQDFLRFIDMYPEWSRAKVKSLFADSHYLESLKSELPDKDKRRPITHVSWFAANAYCESLGKRLPSTDEWEYVLVDRGQNQTAVKDKILAWYGQPNSHALLPIKSNGKNGYGVYDMTGLIWEWTLDFNSFLSGDELRQSGDKDTGLFCGGGSLGMLDPSDYATFMRYSFRTSLKASYTTGNLGFRCAMEGS